MPCPDLELKPGSRGEKPARNGLSYGTAQCHYIIYITAGFIFNVTSKVG
jgi:hypothetical protein